MDNDDAKGAGDDEQASADREEAAARPKRKQFYFAPDQVRERRRNREQETQRTNLSAEGLYAQCQEAYEDFTLQSGRADAKLHATLARTLELYKYAYSDDDEERSEELEAFFKAKKIRRTGSTKNPFTRVVKLVFGNPRERSNVARYAAVLRFADGQGVNAEDLPTFIAENNGIVSCAKADAKEQKRDSVGRTDDEVGMILEKLRQQAVTMNTEEISKKARANLFSALIERDAEGKLRLLSIKEEKEETVRRYSTIDE